MIEWLAFFKALVVQFSGNGDFTNSPRLSNQARETNAGVPHLPSNQYTAIKTLDMTFFLRNDHRIQTFGKSLAFILPILSFQFLFRFKDNPSFFR